VLPPSAIQQLAFPKHCELRENVGDEHDMRLQWSLLEVALNPNASFVCFFSGVAILAGRKLNASFYAVAL
jgi:hypothetical protein